MVKIPKSVENIIFLIFLKKNPILTLNDNSEFLSSNLTFFGILIWPQRHLPIIKKKEGKGEGTKYQCGWVPLVHPGRGSVRNSNSRPIADLM
jgi:hypothetical protein